jgi:hypothetical protein
LALEKPFTILFYTALIQVRDNVVGFKRSFEGLKKNLMLDAMKNPETYNSALIRISRLNVYLEGWEVLLYPQSRIPANLLFIGR